MAFALSLKAVAERISHGMNLEVKGVASARLLRSRVAGIG